MGQMVKPYDTLGIAIHTSREDEVVRVADEVRNWLNERQERGYQFVCAISGLYATILVVRRDHDDSDS